MPSTQPTALLATLAAAGQGMLAWLGLSLVAVAGIALPAPLTGFQVAIACSGIALAGITPVTVLLLRPLDHVARPTDSTAGAPWALRAALLSLLSFLPALCVLYLLLHDARAQSRPLVMGGAGIALLLPSLAALACMSLAQATEPRPGTARHALPTLVFLLFSLSSGLSLVLLLAALRLDPDASRTAKYLSALALTCSLALAAKWLEWRAIDRMADRAPGRADAVALRLICILAFGGVPMFAWCGAALLAAGPAWPWLAAASAGVLTGTFLDHRAAKTRIAAPFRPS